MEAFERFFYGCITTFIMLLISSAPIILNFGYMDYKEAVETEELRMEFYRSVNEMERQMNKNFILNLEELK